MLVAARIVFPDCAHPTSANMTAVRQSVLCIAPIHIFAPRWPRFQD
jgi:hypothetical protein